MESLPSLTRFLALLLASSFIGSTGAIDIAFDTLQCDESLPAYASPDDVIMTCEEGNTRCSFGKEISIRGTRKLKLKQTFGGSVWKKETETQTSFLPLRSFDPSSSIQ